MRTTRVHARAAVAVCSALWIGGGAAMATTLASASTPAAKPAVSPAKRVISLSVELVVTPKKPIVGTSAVVDASKSFATLPNKITSWQVNFGDKSSVVKGKTTKIPKLKHTYKKVGHYTVKLNVKDSSGRNENVTYGFSVVAKPKPAASPTVAATTAPPVVVTSPVVVVTTSPAPIVTTSPAGPTTTVSPIDSPSPSASATTGPASPTSPAATTSPACVGIPPLCLPLGSIADKKPAGGSSNADLAILGLFGLAVLSTPVAVAAVRRKR